MSTEAEIERWVRERAQDRAVTAIRAWLRPRRAGRDAEDALLRACDWYRRLDLLPEAYRLLDLKRSLRASPRRLIWGAWLLHLMGACGWAGELLERVAPEDAEQFRLAGDILLTGFEFDRAIEMYEHMLRADPDPTSYRSRVSSLSYADALAANGRVEDAGEFVREVLARSTEPLLQAISTQALGEYLVQAGRYTEAIVLLEQARRALPRDEGGNDRAFLEKWLGYALVHAGCRRRGLPMLRRAVDLLGRPGRREEAWLQARRLLAELTSTTDLEWARLRAYPGIPAGLRRQLAGPRCYSFGPTTASLTLRPGADEFTRSGQAGLGLSLELKLLAMLVQSGDHGISRLRAKCLLWPNEFHAFGQLDNRLSQIVFRLERVVGVRPAAVEGRLRLPRGASARDVRVEIDELDPRPTFLRGRAVFQGVELEDFYGLSRTERFKVLARWRDRGWIWRGGSGSGQAYLVRELGSVQDF